jgi:hypothetical protein
MGVLAKGVAKLEEKFESLRGLRKTAEQLDTEIVARVEESEGIGTETLALHGDFDDQIAGHHYMTVEQSVTSPQGLMNMETVDAHVDAGLIRLGRYLGWRQICGSREDLMSLASAGTPSW